MFQSCELHREKGRRGGKKSQDGVNMDGGTAAEKDLLKWLQICYFVLLSFKVWPNYNATIVKEVFQFAYLR